MYWCVWELINVTRARIGEEYYSVFIVETRGELQRLKIFFAKNVCSKISLMNLMVIISPKTKSAQRRQKIQDYCALKFYMSKGLQ